MARLRHLRTSTACLALLVPLLALPLAAQPCGTPGRDGSGTITGVVNTYYPGTASTTAASTSISVGTPSGAATPIAAGDLLLVIQMQDAAIDSTDTNTYGDGVAGDPGSGSTNLNSSGLYEYVVATGPVAAGSVPFLGGGSGGATTGGKLIHVYTNANATATQGQRRFQVIRVPQYSSATLSSGLTALTWNGSVGGVLAVDVSGALNLGSATVSVDAQGFRGGGGRSLGGDPTAFNTNAYRTLATQLWHGSKAEGIAGTPRFVYDGTSLVDDGAANEGYPNGSYGRGAPGNAGGGGNDFNSNNGDNSGGGGGGNGGAGGHGGNTWNSNQPQGGFGGAAFSSAASRLALGGGGGAGTSNNTGPGHGAAGGGIILLRLDTATGTGTLSANGTTPPSSMQDGAGGGGAGGSIFAAACTSPNLSGLTADAKGGKGGDVNWTAGDFHGPGGGGGGGVVRLSGTAAAIDVTGGANGITPTSTAFNAVAGSAGVSATTTSVSTGLGARPGCICRVTQVLVTSFGARRAAGGAVVVEWRTASEEGTAGFDLFRLDPRGAWVQVNERLLPAAPPAPQGSRYRFVDPGVVPGGRYTYSLREVENGTGGARARFYGPFTVTADAADAADFDVAEVPVDGFERRARRPTPVPAIPAPVPLHTRTIVAPGPAAAAKLYVKERGLYQLPASRVATLLGLTPGAAAQAIRGGQLELANLGQPVAMEAAPDGSALRFFGETATGIYAPENVYWLALGKKGRSLGTAPGGNPSPAVPGQYFLDSAHFEQQSFPGVAVAADPEGDYWYWAVVIGGDPTLGSQVFSLGVHGLAVGVTGAELTLHLQGASATGVGGEHALSVLVNGTLVGPAGGIAFDGLTAKDVTISLSPALLHEGDNTVEVRGLLAPGVPLNIFYVDAFDLRYPRLYQTAGTPFFVRGAGNRTVTVSGFASPAVQVYDLADPRRPVRLDGLPAVPGTRGFEVSFTPATADRVYLVLDPSGLLAPRAESWVPPALPLRAPNGADHLILAPAALLAPAQALARYRQSQGLASRVVPLEQIYDEWSDGLPDPHAVARFLAYAAASWQPAPRAVVLAGAGSYDYKGYLGLGGNLFPPLLAATPNGLFAADGLYLPAGSRMVVGRLPAASAAELQGYVDKLVAYEGANPGPWRQQVLLVADNPDEGGQFDAESERLAAALPAPFVPTRLYLSELPAAALRAQLLSGLGSGAFLLDYVGHAGLDRLSAQSLLTSADAEALTNGPRLPLVMTMACLLGRFEVPGFRSLAEELVDNPNGGAAAVWAPSGVAFDAQSATLGRAFSDQLFASRAATLGEAAAGAAVRFRAAGGSAATLSTYNLFGDPALRLARPQ